MAKPILLIRIDYTFFTSEQRARLKESLSEIETEYHAIVTSVGAPSESFSFEVHGHKDDVIYSNGDLKATIKGSDIDIVLDRKR